MNFNWSYVTPGTPEGCDFLSPIATLFEGLEPHVSTGLVLYCDKHWDTGAADEWIIYNGMKHFGTFPSKAEAKQFAEITWELQHAA